MQWHSRSHSFSPGIADVRRVVGLLGSSLLLFACPSAPAEVGDSAASTSAAGSTTADPTATSVASTAASGSGIVDETSASAGTGGDPMDCCAAHPEVGCADPDLAACVCKQEASCCAFAWDAACVDLAEQCGGCGPETTTGGTTTGETTGGPSTMCCDPSDQPGCAEDPGLETCVCALDGYCCDTAWDGQCVDLAQSDCALECVVAPGGDCCSAHGSPGCDDPPVEDCVCALDAYCCDNEWDGICVSEAQYACMDDCGLPPPDMGDCCMPQPGPGCGDMVVSECTCMIDSGCCLFPWSNDCIQLAVTSCGIMCGGVDPLPPCCLPAMDPGCSDMVIEDCVCALDAFCCDTAWDGQCVGEAQMDCMLDCTP